MVVFLAVFSVLVAGIGLSFSLLLAVFADRAIRGAGTYKTLLVWPYAVAPVVAAIRPGILTIIASVVIVGIGNSLK